MTELTALRSFIDIRAFAETASVAPLRGEADWLAQRALLPLAPSPLTVGVAAFDAAHGSVEGLPGDEVVILVGGTLEIESAAGTLSLAAGESATLPAGSSFRWRAGATTRAIIVGYDTPSGAAPAPIAIELDAPLVPSGTPLPELLVGDELPACRTHEDYRSVDGRFYSGTWDSTPYHRVAMTYRQTELMQILQGEVTFVDGAGRTCTARTGDIVIIEQGADCSWVSRVHVKKMYVIHRPD